MFLAFNTILHTLPSVFRFLDFLELVFWRLRYFFRHFFVQYKVKVNLVYRHCSCFFVNRMKIFTGGNILQGYSSRVHVCLRFQLSQSDKRCCGGLNFFRRCHHIHEDTRLDCSRKHVFWNIVIFQGKNLHFQENPQVRSLYTVSMVIKTKVVLCYFKIQL